MIARDRGMTSRLYCSFPRVRGTSMREHQMIPRVQGMIVDPANLGDGKPHRAWQ